MSHHHWHGGNAGHKVIAGDVPATVSRAFVKDQATAMGADLISYTRLDKGEGLETLAENSVDLVIFSEILEHITFNPIRMWKAVYKALKPGGRIIITTPNNIYHRAVHAKINGMITQGCIGIGIREIFNTGTYGHHWKEYSMAEIKTYFAMLTSDFSITRYERLGNLNEQLSTLGSLPESIDMTSDNNALAAHIVARLIKEGHDVMSSGLAVEVTLTAKATGIAISAPWEPA